MISARVKARAILAKKSNEITEKDSNDESNHTDVTESNSNLTDSNGNITDSNSNITDSNSNSNSNSKIVNINTGLILAACLFSTIAITYKLFSKTPDANISNHLNNNNGNKNNSNSIDIHSMR